MARYSAANCSPAARIAATASSPCADAVLGRLRERRVLGEHGVGDEDLRLRRVLGADALGQRVELRPGFRHRRLEPRDLGSVLPGLDSTTRRRPAPAG